MSGIIVLVISWLLLAIFFVAFAVRTLRIARLPMHLRWELAPVPHEKGKGRYGGSYLEEFEWWTKPRKKDLIAEANYMFQEIVFLKSVWENNRRVWWFSFPFHIGLYVLIAAAAFLMLGGALDVAGLRTTGLGDWQGGITVLAVVGFALGAIGALGLLVSRFADRRLREFTTPVAWFNLVLLLAIFATGGYAAAVSQDFATRVSSFAGALLTADPSVQLHGILAVHLLLALVFLAYLPFTRMMHFVAKYFTYHEVRWEDEPLAVGGPLEREALRLLDQPVTWAGPHVKSDGKKNWVDIATEEMKT